MSSSSSIARVINRRSGFEYDVYIGRGTKWGNKYSHIDRDGVEVVVGSREDAVESYRDWITKGDGMHLLNHLHELKGKVLCCSCKPLACHGDVLVDLVNDKYASGKYTVTFD